MKQLFKYILILAGIATSLYSCNPNDLINPVEDGNRIELAISLPGLETKAPGEDRFNENKIDNIYYFFYPEGATDSAPVLSGSFAGSEAQSISVSQAKINELFPGGMNRCRLFLVANPPADVASDLRNSASATYNHVRSIVLTTDLNGVQDSFVMTGDALVDLINRNPSPENPVARANVELRRLASKITIKAIVKKTHVDSNVPDVIWTSQADGLKAYFVNGMNKTNLAGDFSMFSDNDVAENRFESLPVSFTRTGYDPENDLATFTIPIYSYPMVWDFEDEREPYLLFELPLQSSKNNKYQLCYYKFMLSEKEMTGNHWYDITVHLNVMGSFFRNEPMQQFLRNDYLVIDWHDAYGSSIDERDENVEADVKAPRYLVFNQDVYEINNMNSLSIPYTSSHPVTATVTSAKKRDYSKSGEFYTEITNQATRDSFFSPSPDGSQVFEFDRTLDNNIDSPNFDCTPWEFEVLIKHTDNPAFNKTIKIIQYPAIYIRTEANSAGRTSGNEGVIANNVYINGSSSNFSDVKRWKNLHGASKPSSDASITYNNSIDMTIITVGRIDSSEYIIGDSRKADHEENWPSNMASTYGENWISAPPVWTGYPTGSATSIDRTLQYYYKPYDDEEHRKYISPQFRISSANSQTYGAKLTYEMAHIRCAGYQEDGYPAGRWRVPTEAEVKFVLKLSGRYIQSLFANGNKYWYAGGYFLSNAAGNDGAFYFGSSYTNDTEPYVRCVYDEWYWSQVDKKMGVNHTKQKNKAFVWGDMSRADVDALFNN